MPIDDVMIDELSKGRSLFVQMLIERVSHVCDLFHWKKGQLGLSGVCIKNKD